MEQLRRRLQRTFLVKLKTKTYLFKLSVLRICKQVYDILAITLNDESLKEPYIINK